MHFLKMLRLHDSFSFIVCIIAFIAEFQNYSKHMHFGLLIRTLGNTDDPRNYIQFLKKLRLHDDFSLQYSLSSSSSEIILSSSRPTNYVIIRYIRKMHQVLIIKDNDHFRNTN